jgi:hypothetical protein
MAGSEVDIGFIVTQIRLCLQLEQECGDPEIAAALRKLGDAFTRRAVVLGAAQRKILENQPAG